MNPRQQEEAGIISQEVTVFLQHLRRPANEAIAMQDAIMGGREGKAGDGTSCGRDKVF